jgi:hypothetical protein
MRRLLLGKLLMALTFLLAACGHVPVMSLVKLARIDFASTDPAQLRAAVKLPQTLKPRVQSMVLQVGVKTADGRELKQQFALRDIADPADVLALRPEMEAGMHIFAYRLDPDEISRVLAFRAAALAQRGGGGGGTVSIQPEACRSGELPTGPILITTYLRTVETGGYVALTRDVDLRTMAPDKAIAAKIPSCG